MAEVEINLRALRNEADWLPTSLEDVVTIRQALIAAGESDSVANGIIGWLVAKAAGEPDNSTASTRARYRKILEGIESPLASSLRSDSSVGGSLAA